MRSILFGVASLGVGGFAFASLDGPDFDRTLKRAPASVYAAFSQLAPEGSRSEETADGRRATIRVEKVRGESIHYEILLDDRPVVTAELGFEGADEGRATRMTAEFDMDAYELGSAFETDAGVALSLVPESFIDRQFASFMDDMADDIEAGRSLPPLSLARSGVQAKDNPEASVEVRRELAEQGRRDAVRPMVRPEPMVDPNRAARNYLNGR